jgi:cell division protein FtsA
MVASGMVLTGGAAKMEGAVDLAEEIFHMPVRLGAPQRAHGLNDIIRNPIYATAVGLLLYGAEQAEISPSRLELRLPSVGWLDGLRQWFGKHF